MSTLVVIIGCPSQKITFNMKLYYHNKISIKVAVLSKSVMALHTENGLDLQWLTSKGPG